MKHEPIKLHSPLWLESARANCNAKKIRREQIQSRIFYILTAGVVLVLAWATLEIWKS